MRNQKPVYHPQPGDTVRVLGGSETYAVIDVAFPLVILRSRTGKVLRAGWRAVEPVSGDGPEAA